MSSVFQTFYNYMGTGLTVIWYLVALIYLFLQEKRRPRRILFVYMPVIVLLLFFNPLFAELFNLLVGEQIYFRIVWLLPVIVTIAYCTVIICERLKGKKAALFTAVCLVLTVVSGKLVYSSPLYSRAENIYHMPDSVVHICDAIKVPGQEVMAAFPIELLQYVRQYSPMVCMPYGRLVLMGYNDEFCSAMNADVIELETLVPMSRAVRCHYLIFRQDQNIVGQTETYGWELFLETDGYVIYRDTNIEMYVPEIHESK